MRRSSTRGQTHKVARIRSGALGLRRRLALSMATGSPSLIRSFGMSWRQTWASAFGSRPDPSPFGAGHAARGSRSRFQRSPRSRLFSLMVGTVLAVLAGTVPAFGFTFARPLGGGVVSVARESADGTAVANVVVYSSPKSGYSWPQYQFSGQWNTSTTYTSLFGSSFRSVEVTVPADEPVLVQAGTSSALFARPSAVAVEATVTSAPRTEAVFATVTAMPAIGLESSVSVAGTLPVEVTDMPEGAWAFLGLGAVALGVGLTSAAIRGVRRGR